MIKVSNEYKKAVYAPTRRTNAKVIFEVFDNEAYINNTITVSKEAEISKHNQLTNKIRNMTNKYGTFEKNYLKLDGSFFIPPKRLEDDSEMGYWSDSLSDENGYFNTGQVVELIVEKEGNSMGLTIYFDVKAKEYAEEFTIEVFDIDNKLITKEEVRNNNSVRYMLERGLDNYKRIRLTIHRWKTGFRRARITEIDFGIIKEYDNESLIDLKIIEELDILSNNLPSNEISFTIDNQNKDFNIMNPQGFYRFLEERQEVKANIGVELEEDVFEEVNMGKFYLTEWISNEGALTITLVARDIFELLENIDYENTNFNIKSLYDLTLDILNTAEIEDFYIDENLKELSTQGFKEKINCREALQLIGMAGMSAIYQDRQGQLIIQQYKALDISDRQFIYQVGMAGLKFGNTKTTVNMGYDMKRITFDNVYSEPQIKLDDLLYKLQVVVYDLLNEKEETIEVVNNTVRAGKSLKLENELIIDVEHAKKIANWIIEEYNQRALYDISWRQNPCLECGDIVLVEDSFGGNKLSRITKQEFNFNGALSGRTSSKGGV